MDLQLGNKRALVTGATGGIGQGIAKTLAQEGAIVVVHRRTDAGASRIVQEILSAGGSATAVLGDLSRDDVAREVAEWSVATMGGVDILVNCAVGYEQMSWMESSSDKWLDMFNHDVPVAGTACPESCTGHEVARVGALRYSYRIRDRASHMTIPTDTFIQWIYPCDWGLIDLALMHASESTLTNRQRAIKNESTTVILANYHNSGEDALTSRPSASSVRGRGTPNLRGSCGQNRSPHSANGREQRRDRKCSERRFWSSQ